MESDPDAVKYKIRGHVIFLLVAVLGGGAVVLRGTFGGQSIDEAGKVAVGIIGFAALGHLLLTFCQPLTISLRHSIALLLVLSAPLGFLIPVLERPEDGWPLNSGNGPRGADGVHSRVVAPGDTVSVEWSAMDHPSVGAHWRGTPEVKVLNAGELGCPEFLKSPGRHDSWKSIIWTRGSLQECPPTLAARFRIPDDAALAGKPVKLQIKVPFTYPAPRGKAGFTNKKATVVRKDEILLAPTEVKDAYWNCWLAGVLIGLGGTTAGGLMLVWLAFGLRVPASNTDAMQPLSVPAMTC